MTDLSSLTVGFLGCGQMATALAGGFVAERGGDPPVINSDRLLGSDPLSESRARFAEVTGGTGVENNADLVRRSDVVFLAVKPHILAGMLEELAGEFSADQVIVSIAAGVGLDRLAELIGEDKRIVRVMPNTPALVGTAACGFARGSVATESDAQMVQRLLEPLGEVAEVPEPLLDAITGLSGSGPAYGYVMIEALSDAGVLMGLPRAIATRFAAQTLKGAAEMVLTTGNHPGALKDAVTSPGGTTIAGLEAIERGGLRSALFSAVRAATERSRELG